MQVSISVSRSLQNKHEQRQAQAADSQQTGKQAAKRLRRKQRLQQQRQLEQEQQQQQQKQLRAARLRDPAVPDKLLDEAALIIAQADGLVPAAVRAPHLGTPAAAQASGPEEQSVPVAESLAEPLVSAAVEHLDGSTDVERGTSGLSLGVATASALPEVTFAYSWEKA